MSQTPTGAAMADSDHSGLTGQLRADVEAFLAYLSAEAFVDGRNWARDRVDKRSPEHYRLLCRIEESEGATWDAALLDVGSELAFATFAGAYFSARHKIEQTYFYTHAFEVMDVAVRFLKTVHEATGAPLFDVLTRFCVMQTALGRIERSCYNSDEQAMAEGASAVTATVTDIRSRAGTLSPDEARLYNAFLEPRLEAHAVYADAVRDVHAMLALRWEARLEFAARLPRALADLDAARHKLTDLGSSILENDLIPQIETLRQFGRLIEAATPVGDDEDAEGDTNANNGTLTICDGRLIHTYYGLIDAEIREAVIGGLRGAIRTGEPYLDLSGLIEGDVEDDPWSDIWAGTLARKVVDSMSWQLPGLSIADFRGHTGSPLEFDVALRCYDFGLFALTIETPLAGRSVSAYRHIASLGSPVGLDECFVWQRGGERFGTLDRFADHVFRRLDAIVAGKTGFASYARCAPMAGPDADVSQPSGAAPGAEMHFGAVTYNLIMNRYTLASIDQLMVVKEGVAHRLTPDQATAHQAFDGLVIPTLEVRVAIDDWIMRRATCRSQNLAALRYYETGEAIHACRHEAVILLLKQASWVREQAWECLNVCAAITNYFCITKSRLIEDVERLEVRFAAPAPLATQASESEIQSDIDRATERLERLARLEGRASEILQMMRSGRVMRFPDLTALLNEINRRMGLDDMFDAVARLLDKTQALRGTEMERLQTARQTLKAEAEAARTADARRLADYAQLIVYVAAIVPMLELVRLGGEALGYKVLSPVVQLAALAVLALVFTLLYLLGRARRDS